MKTTITIFTVLMVICIAGMIYFSNNDSLFSLFSTASIAITLGGTYLIEKRKNKA